ncbi:MAG: cupin domain-containing protein [Desulfovibrionaceae bacterium]|nr:cupin domain-containing protein [Desulfovibrionaceae bacterium]
MSRNRVFLFDQVSPVPRELPGNREPMLSRWGVERDKPLSGESPFTALMVNQLPAGFVIPWHEHTEDEEIYVIISGLGLYLDNEKKAHEVKGGDVAICLKGEKHGLENSGPDPLIFGAVIARK